jgi:large subunit ribosomal protein L10
MLREKKEDVINEMQGVYGHSSFVIAEYQGLTVSDITSLRKSLRDGGAVFKVVKNSLSRIAAKKTDKADIVDILNGPVGIAYSDDAVGMSKSLVAFAKDNENLKIVGGLIDREICYSAQIMELSKLPSIEEIRAKIIGAISAPASNIVRVLNAPASQIARVLCAYASQNNS